MSQTEGRSATGDERCVLTYVGQRSFELVRSADAMWAIPESCSVQENVSMEGERSEARRGGRDRVRGPSVAG